MFRSIRWRLQLWHALLMLGMIGVFGGVLYFQLRHARFQGVDAELLGEAELLAARLMPPRPGRPPAHGPGPDDHKDDRAIEPDLHVHVPSFMTRRYEGTERYFVLWRASGEFIRSSRPELEGEIPTPGEKPRASFPPPRFRSRELVREVIAAGPFGVQVLVGRSVEKEHAELRHLFGLLGMTGAGVTGIGLVGGWLLSRRAVRPIQAITATAQSISATNLSQRIELKGMENELRALAVVLNDMFARLEAAFDRQVRFTADASHELRTPLSVIYSHAELALGKPRSAEEYRQTIETTFRAARRMKSLVDSLLVLARADAGRLEIKHEAFDLAHAAEECAALLAPLAAAKKVRVDLELEPTPIHGDAFRIAQVVTNLLTNAINYNREGGGVTVGVGSENGHAVLSVADTGVGISEADQAHLCERFYRVDKARSREMGGSGLGLAICKSIVEAHGGTIQFSSRLNEGTTFIVRLPGLPSTPMPVDAASAALSSAVAS